MFITEEYDALLREYKPLLNDAYVKEINSDKIMHIETKERQKYEVQLTSKGWRILESTDKARVDDIFETCEALLMTVSPKFGHEWNAILEQRLEQLSGERDEFEVRE